MRVHLIVFFVQLSSKSMSHLFRPTSHRGPVALLVTLLLLLLLLLLVVMLLLLLVVMPLLLLALLTLLMKHRKDESKDQTGAQNLRKATVSMLPPSSLSKDSTEYLSRLKSYSGQAVKRGVKQEATTIPEPWSTIWRTPKIQTTDASSAYILLCSWSLKQPI